jgi:peptide-methionine (S)-S-oxide reductase
VVGYSGSKNPDTVNPTYTNIQDYAESIRVTFDPSKVTYADLLNMFFSFHTPADPTWAGTQYRSAIFAHNAEQRELAELAVMGKRAIGSYVPVEDTSDFYRGEEYHQKYVDKVMQR